MHNFVVHSNDISCRKSGRLRPEQVQGKGGHWWLYLSVHFRQRRFGIETIDVTLVGIVISIEISDNISPPWSHKMDGYIYICAEYVWLNKPINQNNSLPWPCNMELSLPIYNILIPNSNSYKLNTHKVLLYYYHSKCKQ